jgi:hypothetical protein
MHLLIPGVKKCLKNMELRWMYVILLVALIFQMKFQSTKIHPFMIIIAGEHLVLAFRRLRLTDTSEQYQ